MSFPALHSGGLLARGIGRASPAAVDAPNVCSFAGAHGGRYVVTGIVTSGWLVQGFNKTYSGDWTLAAWFGIKASGTLPRGTIAARITATNAMSFAGRAPRGRIASTISSSIGISGDLRYRGQYAISSWTGMQARLATLQRRTLSASITTGSLIRANLRGPRYRLAATITVQNHITANLIGPAVRALHGIRFAGRSPKWRLSAVISQAVTLAYEGYSITLIATPDGYEARTTHLTVCPFDQIVRLGNKYFGVGPDGVYELSGDTYNGTVIASAFETAPLGDPPNMKRPRSLFIGGRLNDDFTAGIKVGESGEYSVGSITPSGTRNHRAKFGRGVQSRYLAYAFANPSGGDFQIDDIAPEFDVLRRTINGVE